MFDAIGQIFQGLIDFLEPILLPDWRALIDLLPIFLVIGVVGPLISRPRSSMAPRCTRRASRTARSTASSTPSAPPAAMSAGATSP
jgi:hypothetical protein